MLARSGQGRAILAAWHGRLFLLPSEMAQGIDVHALISRNRDGEIIARVCALFGVPAIRGSSQDPAKPDRDRGGREALAAALGLLRGRGRALIALTPDGPRGPRMRCQPGVAVLAAATGTPVVPWTFSARPSRILGSWDAFLLPAPFARGVIAYGAVLHPPQDRSTASVEAFRQEIEAALTALTRDADAALGLATPEPGPAFAAG
jgi:hypothetical protein